mmetsp:Transcript_82713/g.146003  ORF Transcript_82713/g.146003 Transcript_82713/m.146003 type:complete len:113 (+) Transcript_82713:249-587(+)
MLYPKTLMISQSALLICSLMGCSTLCGPNKCLDCADYKKREQNGDFGQGEELAITDLATCVEACLDFYGLDSSLEKVDEAIDQHYATLSEKGCYCEDPKRERLCMPSAALQG